ncbi:MAG: threonylcarbamoyl-AMP synthase [Syntrophaceae bacterium]|nr:threonylcarbamoyl-AMP synthase [Syntrophaceae bacterium]
MPETRIISLSPDHPEPQVIRHAAAVLRSGGLVAFPTETVYGLGADAFNERAVRRIFEVKGRPADNPLIVHIASYGQLADLTDELPPAGEKLARSFWPGPLTLVVHGSEGIPDVVTAGLDTVAVRMPDNAVTLELIRELGSPIVGPSANLSGRPSPTAARHVYDDLNGKIDLILDAGPARIGVESTVIDVTSDPPVILRFGGLTRERIERCVGPVLDGGSDDRGRRSPGTRHRHYAPRAQVILVDRGDAQTFERLFRLHSAAGKKVGFIVHSIALPPTVPCDAGTSVTQGVEQYTRLLFRLMREMDARKADVLLVERVEETGLGRAVMDRLVRAARGSAPEQA